MKRFALFFLVLSVAVTLSAQTTDSAFVIEGTIPDVDGEFIYISYPYNAKTVIDSSRIINEKFKLSGKVSEPTLGYLRLINNDVIDNRAAFVFLEPGNMAVEVRRTPFSITKIEGSESHLDIMQYNELNADLKNRFATVLAAPRSGKDEERTRTVEDSILLYTTEKERLERDFFKQHPRSYATAYILGIRHSKYTKAELLDIYNGLGNIVQESVFGRYLLERIKEKQNYSREGTIAKDFAGKDLVTGASFSLSSVRGHYVLIDFWGSWCKPCISLIPSLVSKYNKYKDHNILFVSVAYDAPSDLPKAKEIIIKSGMTWINLWQDSHTDDKANSITSKFDIRVYPSGFLVDPDGRIVSRSDGTDGFIKLSRALESLFDGPEKVSIK